MPQAMLESHPQAIFAVAGVAAGMKLAITVEAGTAGEH